LIDFILPPGWTAPLRRDLSLSVSGSVLLMTYTSLASSGRTVLIQRWNTFSHIVYERLFRPFEVGVPDADLAASIDNVNSGSVTVRPCRLQP
jgi:hypothetical protein